MLATKVHAGPQFLSYLPLKTFGHDFEQGRATVAGCVLQKGSDHASMGKRPICASSSLRCRIKAALKISRDKGLELRVRHTLRNWGDGGLELSRHQRRNHAHEYRPDAVHAAVISAGLPKACQHRVRSAKKLLTQFVA